MPLHSCSGQYEKLSKCSKLSLHQSVKQTRHQESTSHISTCLKGSGLQQTAGLGWQTGFTIWQLCQQRLATLLHVFATALSHSLTLLNDRIINVDSNKCYMYITTRNCYLRRNLTWLRKNIIIFEFSAPKLIKNRYYFKVSKIVVTQCYHLDTNIKREIEWRSD